MQVNHAPRKLYTFKSAPRPPRSRWAHRRRLWRRRAPRRWPGAAALLPRRRRRLPVRPVVGSFYSDSAQSMFTESMITDSMITAHPEPSRQVAAVCGYHFAAQANQRIANCICASTSKGSPAGAPAARGRGRALMPQPPGPAPAAARCCAWQRPGGRGRPRRRPPPPLPPARRPAGCAAASPLRRPAALPLCCASAAARLWEGHRGACGNAERGTQCVLGYAASHLTSQVLDRVRNSAERSSDVSALTQCKPHTTGPSMTTCPSSESGPSHDKYRRRRTGQGALHGGLPGGMAAERGVQRGQSRQRQPQRRAARRQRRRLLRRCAAAALAPAQRPAVTHKKGPRDALPLENAIPLRLWLVPAADGVSIYIFMTWQGCLHIRSAQHEEGELRVCDENMVENMDENTTCRTGGSLLGGGLPFLAGHDGLLQRLQQDGVHGQPLRLLRELLRLRERRLPRPSAGCRLRICRQRLRLRGPRRRRVKQQSSSEPRRAYSAAGTSPANERHSACVGDHCSNHRQTFCASGLCRAVAAASHLCSSVCGGGGRGRLAAGARLAAGLRATVRAAIAQHPGEGAHAVVRIRSLSCTGDTGVASDCWDRRNITQS